MRKWPKTQSEDLRFVRKYCLLGTYPASDARCGYIAESSGVSADKSDLKDVDAIFLCRFPDREMPPDKARLTSELDQCPYTKRRKMIDAFYVAEV